MRRGVAHPARVPIEGPVQFALRQTPPTHYSIEVDMEIKSQPVPLRTDAEGTVRVAETRVPLETVIHVFDQGATPEEIVQRFSALTLGDVYSAVGYYLHHRDEVQRYMARQKQRAASIRSRAESRSDVQAIRERLLRYRST